MNRYGITVNNQPEHIQHASKAYTAVRNEMARYVEGEFKPFAHIKVRFIGKTEYTWDIIADVPFDYGDNGKGRKRETVAKDFTTKESADIEMQKLSTSHSDWHFIRLLRKTKHETN